MINQSGAAIGEVIDLESVKEHLRVDYESSDTLIQRYLNGALGHLERVCNTVFLTTEFTSVSDSFTLSFAGYPNPSIISATYVDDLGATVTLTDYSIKDGAFCLEDEPTDLGGDVTIVFNAGLGAGNIPEDIILAALLLTAGAYDERNESPDYQTYALSFGYRQLIAPHRAFGYAL